MVQGFFGVLLEALRIFLGLDFWLHLIVPVTRNLDYPPGPVVHNLSPEKEQLTLKLKKPMQVFMRWSATKYHIHLERYCKPFQKFMFLNLCFDWQVKVSFIDGSIKTYLEYVGLLWQIYLSFMTFECIWLCSADKILLHIITYSWLSYNSLYNLITVPVVHNLSREKEQLALKLKKPMQVFMRWSATKCHIHLERYCKPFQKFMFLN